MAFLTGPRQVGKTTLARNLADVVLNWDVPSDRRIIAAGANELAAHLRLDRAMPRRQVVALDEVHKFPRWRNLLKGFFDAYHDRAAVIVTGSARFELARRGGDSLMGRYFVYRVHPFSVAEIASPDPPDERTICRPPRLIRREDLDALWRHGGFPEPFVRRTDGFSRRWRRLRAEQLVRGEIRDLTAIHQLDQVEMLARILAERSGRPLAFSTLAGEVGVSVDTIRRWIATFRVLYLGFVVRPWYRNIARALRKEPRWYLADWSGIEDEGARFETMVAAHLLKAVEGWTDLGWGDFELRYLRDKDKREVDFLLVRDGRPWCLVESKLSDERPSPALSYYQATLRAPHAVQVVWNLEPVEVDAFGRLGEPVTVPAGTFLSQLL